jgi:hypothetical protein
VSWITETNAPATPEQIATAQQALGVPIPDILRALYARHDGLMTFLREHVEDGEPGGPSLHLFGVASENLRTDGLLSGASDSEFLDYVCENHPPGVSPLVFETASFGEWIEDVSGADDFPAGWICIAANVHIHDSYWVPARLDAAIVVRLPSPRFALGADFQRALKATRQPLRGWLAESFPLT